MEVIKRQSKTFDTLNALLNLESKWFKLHNDYIPTAPLQLQTKYWILFKNLYQEPQRYYHNVYHIAKLNDFYDYTVCQTGLLHDNYDHSNFLLSLWFHDAIYDPKKADNEQQSSELFQEYSKEANLSQEQTKLVSNIIMATVKHQIDPQQFLNEKEIKACKVFLDADLSVLGWNSEEYDEYAQRIWEEYSFYGWEAFCKGRASVLVKMLDKQQLYFTEEIKILLEVQARENIKNELKRLENGKQLFE